MKLLKNARVYTLNASLPSASALVIADSRPGYGTVLAVGDSGQLAADYGHLAEVEDLGGKTVLPGLTDAHIHLRHFSHALNSISLFGTSKDPGLQLITEKARQTPAGEWITAYGWSQDLWGDPKPDTSMLDAAAPENPLLVMGVSLHVLWANRAAMHRAGITAASPEVPKGKTDRDLAGKPTGLFFEEAMKLFNHVLPDPVEEATLALFENAQRALWQMGITGVHDFDRIPSFVTLQTLRNRGRLKLRVLKNLPVESLDALIASGLRSGFGDDLLRIGSIKAFADGALGSRTAAMTEPYLDDPGNRGMLQLDEEEMLEFGRVAVRNGFSLTIHAIGDAANHEMLNAFEHLRNYEKDHNLPHYRHRLEHAQLLHPTDLDRLAALDLIASMQPIHATSDMEMADLGWGERSRNGYAWRTLKDRGTRLAFGSDAPVDTPDPFAGLHAAVTRRKANGDPGPEGWYPEQRLSLDDALEAYTRGPAYAAGMEERLGMLAPGCLADLIVLDEDPFQTDPENLRRLQPLATMVGGEWVYRTDR